MKKSFNLYVLCTLYMSNPIHPRNLGYFYNFRDRIVFIRESSYCIWKRQYTQDKSVCSVSNLHLYLNFCISFLCNVHIFCEIKIFLMTHTTLLLNCILFTFLRSEIFWFGFENSETKWWSVLRILSQTILYVDFRRVKNDIPTLRQ